MTATTSTSTLAVVIIAALAPVGALIGGTVVALLQRRTEARKWILDARFQSYVSLIRSADDAVTSIAKLYSVPKDERSDQDEIEYFRDLQEISKAASEISLLGPPPVAEAAYKVRLLFGRFNVDNVDDDGEELVKLRRARNLFDREAALGVSNLGPLGRRRLRRRLAGTASRYDDDWVPGSD